MLDSPAGTPGQAPWILVVDRDESAGESLARRFRGRGLAAYAAASGREALRQAQVRAPTLAIVDVRLHDMAGVELARWLRRYDPETAVVMMTSDLRPVVEVKARQVGIVYYAHKPLDLDRLDAITAQAFAHALGIRPRTRPGICPGAPRLR